MKTTVVTDNPALAQSHNPSMKNPLSKILTPNAPINSTNVNAASGSAVETTGSATTFSYGEGYIIANPIYDTVFKRLMENNRVARFFIETMIDQPVENVTVSAQDHTYYKVPSTVNGKELTEEQLSKVAGVLSIMRYDFIATIRTPDGHKKVLIEIQKAKNADCIKRFRDYVGEQYQREDIVEIDGKKVQKPLPIITIYLLGYNLAETEATVIYVSRQYHDVLGNKKLELKSDFIECLTHDSYVVQLRRIEGKSGNRLEKMLSVFEQNNFRDEKYILKNYNHDLNNDPDVRKMIEILQLVGADPEIRKDIEVEWRSNELLEKFFREEEENANFRIQLAQKDEALAQKDEALAQKDQDLAQTKQSLEQTQNALAQKDIDTVLNANNAGVPIEIITKIAGLTREEVEKIIILNT